MTKRVMSLCELSTNDPLVAEVRSKATLVNFDDGATDGVSCFLIDCADRKNLEEIAGKLKELRTRGIPMLFLHPEQSDFSSIFGAGVGGGTEATFVYSGADYDIIRPLGQRWEVTMPPTESVTLSESEIQAMQQDPNIKGHRGDHAPPDDPSPSELGAPPAAAEVPAAAPDRSIVEEAIELLQQEEAKALHDSVQSQRRRLPVNLPEHQYHYIYHTLNASGTLTRPGGWNGDFRNQDFSAILMYEILLVASFNPALKYMRVETMGSGFSPHPMSYDYDTARGYAQEVVYPTARPLDPPPDLQVRSTSPRNTNNQQEITTEASFDVGIDGQPSVAISRSITQVVSDFNVTNFSSGISADWGWHWSMTQNNHRDVFDLVMVTPALRYRIRQYPPLARANLQTSTIGVWQVPSTRANPWNRTVTMQLSFYMRHFLAWLTGNMAHSRHWAFPSTSASRTVSVDFSRVRA